MEDKLNRLKEKYIEALQVEQKNAEFPANAPKRMLLDEIEYAYITFKNTDTKKRALK